MLYNVSTKIMLFFLLYTQYFNTVWKFNVYIHNIIHILHYYIRYLNIFILLYMVVFNPKRQLIHNSTYPNNTITFK